MGGIGCTGFPLKSLPLQAVSRDYGNDDGGVGFAWLPGSSECQVFLNLYRGFFIINKSLWLVNISGLYHQRRVCPRTPDTKASITPYIPIHPTPLPPTSGVGAPPCQCAGLKCRSGNGDGRHRRVRSGHQGVFRWDGRASRGRLQGAGFAAGALVAQGDFGVAAAVGGEEAGGGFGRHRQPEALR